MNPKGLAHIWSCAIVGLVLLLLMAAPVEAAVIEGRTTDAETREPIRFVTVTLVSESYTDGTITTTEGEFRFASVPPGTYALRFNHVGYETTVQTISVASTSERRVLIAMRVDPIPMQEVEVIGDRQSLERQIQTGYVELGRRELMAVPSIGEPDPIRTLQFLPGVQAASDISSGLYVRGGGPDQTLILLDRVPLYNPTHAFGLFSTFSSDAVERTTLYKGAYPAEFGGRLGAVLDVQNREGDNNGFKGKISLSTITGRAHLEGPLDQGGSWMLSGRRTYLEPFLSALRSEENQIPSYYFYDLNGKVRLTAPGDDKLVVTGYLGRDNLEFELENDGFINIGWGNTAVSAVYNRSFSSSLLGTVTLAGTEYQSDTEVRIFSTPFRFANRIQDISARSDLTWESSRNTFRAGALASFYEFTFLQIFNQSTQLDLTTRPYGLALYLQDELRLGTRTSIRAGVRSRYFSDGDRTFLEPRISLSQGLGRFRLKLGGGIYNQVLQLVSTEGFSAGDFYVPVDETVSPSRSAQIVAGIDWDISRRYQASIEAYQTKLDDLLLLDNNVPPDQESIDTVDLFLTGGTGYARGLEMFLQRRTGRITGWIGYTLGWTRRTFDELNQGREFPPKYDRRHDVNVVANYRSGPWSLGGAFVYGTGQAFTPAVSRFDIQNPATGELPASSSLLPAAKNSARLLPYHRLDVSVTRDMTLFGRPGQWFIQIFNLYSRRNEWFVQYDTQNPATEPEVVKQLPLIPSLGFNLTF